MRRWKRCVSSSIRFDVLDVLAEDAQPSAARRVQPVEHLQQRRLAAAVRAQQRRPSRLRGRTGRCRRARTCLRPYVYARRSSSKIGSRRRDRSQPPAGVQRRYCRRRRPPTQQQPVGRAHAVVVDGAHLVVEAAREHRLVDVVAHPEGAAHQHADRRHDPPPLLLAGGAARRCGSCAPGTCRSPCAARGRCSGTSSPARARTRSARAARAATSGCRPISSSGSAGWPARPRRRPASTKIPAAIRPSRCTTRLKKPSGMWNSSWLPTKKIEGRMTTPLNSPIPSQTRLMNSTHVDRRHGRGGEHQCHTAPSSTGQSRESPVATTSTMNASSFARGSRRCRKPSLRAFSSENTACSMLPLMPASVFSTKPGLTRFLRGRSRRGRCG